jgi:branched-chain amino acid transport system permease protein
MNRRTAWDVGLSFTLLVALALVPHISADIPKLFSGPINSPGTLQLLALCLVFAGVALTYDLLFGYTGLLSFGHAFYFAVGVYMTAIALTHWHWSFAAALLFVALLGLVLPLVVGAVSLRVGGIAFAMVTLAVAQIGAVLAIKNPYGWTGGEEGFGTDYTKLPDAFVGVLNTKNLYWLALAYAAAVFLVVRWAVNSSPGRVWQAIRENEQRVEVLGLHPHPFKLMAFVLSSFLATVGGVVYLLLGTGPNPEVTTANFTLALLIMVVLGGTGTKWGAMIGGVLYTYLNNRLGAVGDSSFVQGLPDVLRTPLSEPLFLLGTLFVLIVFFAPGGIAGLARPSRPSALRRLEDALRTERAEVTAPVQTTEEGV